MNKTRYALLSFLTLVSPVVVSAHEMHVYEIGGIEYEIVVGSRNEPVIVDDKTGVELEIVRDGEMFEGAHNTLKVEMIAGDKKRIDSLEPVYGAIGKYKTNFIATVPTTLSYRVFGTLENVPFDQTYTCNPVGHPQSVENTDRAEISSGVTQTLMRGNFGCPQPKEAFGFPESAPSGVALQDSVDAAKNIEIAEPVAATETRRDGCMISVVALILAGLSLITSLVLMVRSKKRPNATAEIHTN